MEECTCLEAMINLMKRLLFVKYFDSTSIVSILNHFYILTYCTYHFLSGAHGPLQLHYENTQVLREAINEDDDDDLKCNIYYYYYYINSVLYAHQYSSFLSIIA